MLHVRLAIGLAFGIAVGAIVARAQPQVRALGPLAPLLSQLDPVTVSDGRIALDRAAAKGEGALAPAGLVVSAPMVLLGSITLVAQDASELIAWMKAKGRAVRVAHAGAWSSSLECALQLQELIETKFTLVAAADGTEALEKLKTGAVDVLCDAVPLVMADVQSGAVIAHVLASDERLPSLWDVTTADQVGLPLFSATAWLGLYAPAADALKVSAALQTGLADEALVQKLAELGWTPFAPALQTPDAHMQHLASEAERRSARLSTDGLPLDR